MRALHKQRMAVASTYVPVARPQRTSHRRVTDPHLATALSSRFEASILYFNAEHVRNLVWPRVSVDPSLRLVFCDLSNSPYVDVAGGAMLTKLNDEVRKRGAVLRIVEARARTRDLLRAVGLEKQTGYFGRHMSIDQALLEFEQSADSTP